MKMGAGERTDVDRERNFEYSNKGTYGTSGFMTEDEMHNIFDVEQTFRCNNGDKTLRLHQDI